MRINHILEQGTGHQNEDYLVIEKNLFGVFDGASSLDKDLFEGGKTGGSLAAAAAGQVFSKNHYPLSQLGVQANQAILSKMLAQKVDIHQRHKLWSTSAAVVRIKTDTIEWLQTGDAHILLLYADGSSKVLVDREDHDFETLSLLKHNNFKPSAAFQKQVKTIRTKMNRTYGVLNGEPEAVSFMNTGLAPVRNVQTVLLFTDGLQIPGKTPQKKRTFKQLTRLYKKRGLKGLRNSIREIESQDPEIKRYPRFKCHDDIAAIAIDL